MHLFNKRFIYSYIIVFIAAALIGGLIVFTYDSSQVFNDNVFDNKPTIVIDAGHGGEDGGAVSASGILEKDINLDIAKKLELLFLQSGFNVVMTRSTDNAIYDKSANTLREKKISDIHNRSEIVNKADNNILISIHQNKFEESKYKGAQVFYSTNDTLSPRLAEHIKIAIKGLLQNQNERECKAATKDIYILHNAKVPSVLVECGFLSNPEEEQLLNNHEYKSCMAYAIYSGFLEYYYQYY